MSLLVEYTLSDAVHHETLQTAMKAMISALKTIKGRDFEYSSFYGEDPVKFYALLSFGSDDGKNAFLESEAFAAYRETVKPLLIAPPKSTNIKDVASTL